MNVLYRTTFRCDKNCYFCYNNVFKENMVDYSCHEESNIEPLIKLIQEKKIDRVSMSGGEPAVREDIIDIISVVSQYAEVKVFSNGLLLKKFDADIIVNSGINKIVLTIYDSYLNDSNNELEVMENKIIQLRKVGIVIDGNMFLDIKYFDKKRVIEEIGIRQIFDNVRWQPLVLPDSSDGFKNTIIGMDKNERKVIFQDVISENWGEVASYYSMFEKWLEHKKQPLPCTFGKHSYTVEPNLKFSVCPHKSKLHYSADEIDEVLIKDKCVDCLCPQCMSIYSWE